MVILYALVVLVLVVRGCIIYTQMSVLLEHKRKIKKMHTIGEIQYAIRTGNILEYIKKRGYTIEKLEISW